MILYVSTSLLVLVSLCGPRPGESFRQYHLSSRQLSSKPTSLQGASAFGRSVHITGNAGEVQWWDVPEAISSVNGNTVDCWGRRKTLRAIGASSLLLLNPVRAHAKQPVGAENVSNVDDKPGMVSAADLADRLRRVPTFTIVDKRGVPFMVFGEDAHVTAYFFTSYEEAKRILDVARTSSDETITKALKELREKKAAAKEKLDAKAEKEEVGSNPWKDARISTVPLDFAVSLAIKASSASGVYFQVAPAQEDVEDALLLDKSAKGDLAEGKVPLFYFEDFDIPGSSLLLTTGQASSPTGPEMVSPLYFRKSELVAEWKRRFPGKDTPDIKVTELFSVLTEMVKPGGDDDDLKALVFVPPTESYVKAKECRRKGGKQEDFRLGERIVVL